MNPPSPALLLKIYEFYILIIELESEKAVMTPP